MQIEEIRTLIEEFERRLNRELYGYYAGHKESMELSPIYGEYSDLFSLSNIRGVQSRLGTMDSFQAGTKRSLEKILRYLVNQNLDCRVARSSEEIERFERERVFLWGGTGIGLLHPLRSLKSEADAGKRKGMAERWAAAWSEADDLRWEKILQLRTASKSLGFEDYVHAIQFAKEVDCRMLVDSLEPVLRRTEDRYLELMRSSFQSTLGLRFEDAGVWDVPRWRMLNGAGETLRMADLHSLLSSFISDLGIRPERSDSVSMEIATRATGFHGALCIPVSIPHEIRIVLRPENGAESYGLMLHEMGHACHFAWTSASLPIEHRVWGDRSVSECYAFLLEHFTYEPEWLERFFPFVRSDEFLRFQWIYRAFLMRCCVGKLRFALRLHRAESVDDVPGIYAQVMREYTGLGHLPGAWSSCLAEAIEAADHLRGWIFEFLLREHLYRKYGAVTSRAATGFLKELWETGFMYGMEQLCREIGLGDPEPEVLGDALSGGRCR